MTSIGYSIAGVASQPASLLLSVSFTGNTAARFLWVLNWITRAFKRVVAETDKNYYNWIVRSFKRVAETDKNSYNWIARAFKRAVAETIEQRQTDQLRQTRSLTVSQLEQ